MKTNLSTKTITGISLMALFIVGCSGGDQNSTRPSFQSPSSSRSFPLSGGTSSSVTPAAPAESNVSGNEEPAAPQTAAAEDGNADIQEAIDAANAAAAAANQAAAASNKAASSADGAQTAGIVAAVLGGLGIAASVGGDYLVNKKSSERDEGISSSISTVGQKVDRNLEVDLAGHAGTQVKVDGVASGQTGVIQRLDAREEADSLDAELAAARHHESMSAIAEINETLEFAKNLLLEEVKKLATAEQVTALTEEIEKAASAEDPEKVQTKLIEAFENFLNQAKNQLSQEIGDLKSAVESAPSGATTEQTAALGRLEASLDGLNTTLSAQTASLQSLQGLFNALSEIKEKLEELKNELAEDSERPAAAIIEELTSEEVPASGPQGSLAPATDQTVDGSGEIKHEASGDSGNSAENDKQEETEKDLRGGLVKD